MTVVDTMKKEGKEQYMNTILRVSMNKCLFFPL